MIALPTSSSTRLYFARVPAERRDTLIAKREGNTYRFDIHMQGERETVFFDA